jgi:Phosphoserine phosphatase RsbU, N-terminal domain/GAF domain
VASAAQNELRRSYAAGLQAYLRDPNERTLRAAYELGREAVTRELDVLDLALVHHEALAAALRSAGDDLERLTRSAADFLVESLSAFEMIRRAYTEARDAAALERRQASMLRQLSSLLADASLALDAGSLDEMLRLVAEQARELTGAACCVAALAGTDGPEVEAAALDDGDEHAAAFVESAGLRTLAGVLDSAARAVRMSGDEVAAHPDSRDLDLRGAGWLAAPLTTLDERQIGWIQLLADAGADFTEIDEAVLAHLAQMTSATVERARMYSRSRS